jgi:hypothetical protein
MRLLKKSSLLGVIFYFMYLATYGQEEKKKFSLRLGKIEVEQRKKGMLLGYQAGRVGFLDVGMEQQWKKVRIKKPMTYAANASIEYNLANHVLGYQVGGWYKPGRFNFTYGGHLSFYTDFESFRYGIGPEIGYKLAGFHFLNGYNLLLGNQEMKIYNPIYVSVRYFIPIKKKTTITRVKPEPKKSTK